MFPFDHTENIIKPFLFWRFQGDQKGTRVNFSSHSPQSSENQSFCFKVITVWKGFHEISKFDITRCEG